MERVLRGAGLTSFAALVAIGVSTLPAGAEDELPPELSASVPELAREDAPATAETSAGAADGVPELLQPPAAPPAFHVSLFARLGFRLQDPSDPTGFGDLSVDTANVTPVFSGNAFDQINWTASFFAVAQTTPGSLPPAGGSLTVLDLIAQFDLHDAFHVWAGRMIIPSDRSDFSGPFFMSAWNYPGLYTVGGPPIFVGPKADYLGRGVGGTLWGELQGGLFKYYAGAYQLDQASASPLFSGRLNLALLSPEPGYYSSSSYFGQKEIVAIGIGAQAQKNGSNAFVVDPTTGALSPGAAEDYSELNADVLAEVEVGGGTLTGEAAVYKFNGAASAARVDTSFFVLASYLLPFHVGSGRFQPLVRYQATLDPDMNMLDIFMGYILKGPALRIHAGYQRTDLGNGVTGNAVQLGTQILHL